MIESIAGVAREAIHNLSNGGTPMKCWEKTLLPFFKSEFFPKTDIAMSSKVTASFLEICLFAGDAFPSAVNYLSHWMKAAPPISPGSHLASLFDHHSQYQKMCQKY